MRGLGTVPVAFTVVLAGVLAASQAADQRWTFSAGVSARQISADFQAGAPGVIDWHDYVTRRHSPWDRGVYNGSTESKDYRDGSVVYDPTWTPTDGTAFYSVQNASQYGTRDAYDTITYRTFSYAYTPSAEDLSGRGCREKLGAGPYLEARFRTCDCLGGTLSLLARYVLQGYDMDSPTIQVRRQTITEEKLKQKITYDVDPLSWGGGVVAPPGGPTDGYWLIYNADMYNANWGADAVNPRRNTTREVLSTTELSAREEQNLDMWLHTGLIGGCYERRLGERVSVHVTAGPTFNALYWDFNARKSWRDDGTGLELAAASTGDHGTQTAFGVSAYLGAMINLARNGRFFLQADAGYDWVDSVEIESGDSSVEVDASSFSASAGVGMGL